MKDIITLKKKRYSVYDSILCNQSKKMFDN